MTEEVNLPDQALSGEFIVYRSTDGRTEVQLRAVDGTVWLTQAQIADLFDKSVKTVSEHIQNIYDEGECSSAATFRKFRKVQSEGGREVTRHIDTYNLDVILAVGYRVRSPRGVQFRQWATTVLREYLIKGFAMDDARLKDPAGMDYFDELLERIRDIRASEKRFYQKVKDVFAQTSVDYDKASETAKTFFATIQNKLLYSVTGRTAGELICDRSNPNTSNMGLTTWKSDVVRKADVDIAKNYLAEGEVRELNRLTTMFLDYAADNAARRVQLTMRDWTTKADAFLRFNDREVLTGAGTVRADAAKRIVHERFDEFDRKRRAAALEASEREAVAELEDIAKKHKRP